MCVNQGGFPPLAPVSTASLSPLTALLFGLSLGWHSYCIRGSPLGKEEEPAGTWKMMVRGLKQREIWGLEAAGSPYQLLAAVVIRAVPMGSE